MPRFFIFLQQASGTMLILEPYEYRGYLRLAVTCKPGNNIKNALRLSDCG